LTNQARITESADVLKPNIFMQFMTAFFPHTDLRQIRRRKIRHSDEATVADWEAFENFMTSWSWHRSRALWLPWISIWPLHTCSE